MKILVVDDERDMQQLFEQRFRKEINDNLVELVFAFSGEEALSYLEKNQHDAVLILSDINMPGMTGLELLSRIKQKYVEPAPVVMIMTAYGDDHNYHAAKELGADEFLTKPIAFNILKEKLKTQL